MKMNYSMLTTIWIETRGFDEMIVASAITIYMLLLFALASRGHIPCPSGLQTRVASLIPLHSQSD